MVINLMRMRMNIGSYRIKNRSSLLDISGMDGVELLTPEEKQLCSVSDSFKSIIYLLFTEI